MDEPPAHQARPTSARRGRFRAVTLGVLVLALAATAIVISRGEDHAVPAVAEPTPELTPASSTTAPESSTTSEAPPDTEGSTTTTLPPPQPGPPVWPTTGAQGKTGGSVTIYTAMNGRRARTLSDPWGPLPAHPAFRVLNQRGDWLEVALPYRPNGATGWIRRNEVNLFSTTVSIDVDLAARWITVYDKDNVVLEAPVVTGTPATPTPEGEFYISDLIPNPGGPYGTYAFGLAAHSDVLTDFAGGDGQVAIHGTNQPQLMGTASSHGCIRLTNDVASRLARLANVPGVPVRVHTGAVG